MTDGKARDEAEIRGILDDWREAYHAKDAEALTTRYAPDVLSYSLAPPLMARGADLLGLTAWLAGWDGPVDYQIHDLRIEAGDGVAFSTSLNWMRATATNGERTDLWTRATVGYRKIGGQWKVVHEHISVPFYMDGSVMAALDLKP